MSHKLAEAMYKAALLLRRTGLRLPLELPTSRRRMKALSMQSMSTWKKRSKNRSGVLNVLIGRR